MLTEDDIFAAIFLYGLDRALYYARKTLAYDKHKLPYPTVKILTEFVIRHSPQF